MTRVFDSDYSSSYDLLYESKDYEAECDLIEKIIQEHCKTPVNSILDLGCGTGNHSIRLAQRGYQITGVDLSEDMLEIARNKALKTGLNCDFFHSDLREFSDHKKYDVIIMMFAVLGYQIENIDVLKALNTVRKHLKKGGIFICDVWYGPAVLHEKPGEKVKIIEKGEIKIIRVSTGILNIFHHFVDVHFHLWKIKRDKIIFETVEEHRMRFFFPQELRILFNDAKMHLIRIQAFPDIDSLPNEFTWNVIAIGEIE
jgi:SAM-dependent methyltransferase